MEKEQYAFQITTQDNVATALTQLNGGTVFIRGDKSADQIIAVEFIEKGHKIALKNIKAGEDILKYGVCIGRANVDISSGSWVHLHNIRSIYDERSSHLDTVTGVPKDINYE